MGYEGDAGSRPCRALRKRVQEQQDRREGAAGRAQGRSDMGPTLQRTEEGEAMGGGAEQQGEGADRRGTEVMIKKTPDRQTCAQVMQDRRSRGRGCGQAEGGPAHHAGPGQPHRTHNNALYVSSKHGRF